MSAVLTPARGETLRAFCLAQKRQTHLTAPDVMTVWTEHKNIADLNAYHICKEGKTIEKAKRWTAIQNLA